MQLTCPHCTFSKQVPNDRLPSTPTQVTCPQCRKSFPFPTQKTKPPAASTINCPACHQAQTATEVCSTCGLIFAKYRAPQSAPPVAASDNARLQDKPKAGFWLRLVALITDLFIIGIIQFVLTFVISVVVGHNGSSTSGEFNALLFLFGHAVFFAYFIIFTSQNGQTPGKMIVNIQVISTDGSSVNFTKAFYREVIGKIFSWIIFCIGYLMAAFDEQKQGLHDRMAKTYVIKL